MDKRSIFGFVLIALVITAWMVYTSSQQVPPPKKKIQEQEVANKETTPIATSTDAVVEKYGELFAPWARLTQEKSISTVTIENDVIIAEFSSKGATLTKLYLKKYNNWYGKGAQLVPFENNKGELGISFVSTEGKEIDTRNFAFDLLVNGTPANATYNVAKNDSLVLTAVASLQNGASVSKSFVIKGDSYYMQANIELAGFDNVVANKRYFFGWEGGLQYQDRNSVEESNSGKAVVSLAGTVAEVDAAEVGKEVSTRESGKIDFAAVKSKYFGVAIVPNIERDEYDVIAEGTRRNAPNEGAVESYSIQYRLPYKSSTTRESFTIYAGPLDYEILREYGLTQLVEFGWGFIRYIGEYALMPFFNLVHMFIPNFGFAIVVFSLFIKMLLYPLSLPQMRSAEKMKLLQPEIKKIQDKYKDDQMAMQRETMALYSRYGVNPAGGCLPLLLQFPILIALWSLFNSSIQLRQQPFFGWITDLSVPDVILTLPFAVPFMGNEVAGLAILMGLTMFIQQKMTVTDPRQQAVVYMMPPMMIILFAHLPSGLNLYYFMFNLLGIAQQVWVGKFSKNKITLEEMKKTPVKEGWLQRKMREAQEIAESQGRTLPGQNPSANKSSGKKKK